MIFSSLRIINRILKDNKSNSLFLSASFSRSALSCNPSPGCDLDKAGIIIRVEAHKRGGRIIYYNNHSEREITSLSKPELPPASFAYGGGPYRGELCVQTGRHKRQITKRFFFKREETHACTHIARYFHTCRLIAGLITIATRLHSRVIDDADKVKNEADANVPNLSGTRKSEE